ncbi:MAG TPA: hypothetical protein VGH50_09180 [Candidatus Binatia bacterium]|jgi:hypothetical protein
MSKVTVCAFLSLAAIGCATFKPEWKYQDLINAHRPQATDAHNGVEISVENISAETAKKIFDSDLRSNGVLPVFIKASNKSMTVFRVSANNTKAAAVGETLPVLRGVDAADLAGSRAVAGKAALWFLAGGATGLALSGANTASVNHDIEHHFENLEFGNSTLQPNQVIGGFIYLKLPETIKPGQNIIVEIPATEEKTGASTVFKFSITF